MLFHFISNHLLHPVMEELDKIIPVKERFVIRYEALAFLILIHMYVLGLLQSYYSQRFLELS